MDLEIDKEAIFPPSGRTIPNCFIILASCGSDLSDWHWWGT